MARKPRLLIVDDEPSILNQMRWALCDDYDVIVARDPEEARCRMTTDGPPDIALIDLHLPPACSSIVEGIRLIETVRRDSPATRVLAFTSEPGPDGEQRSLAAGAGGLLAKPVRREDLLRALKRFDEPTDTEDHDPDVTPVDQG